MVRLSWSSMRVRLLALVMLAMGPALGLALVAGLQYRDTLARRVDRSLHRQAGMMASAVGETFTNTETFLAAAASLPQTRSHNRAAASEFLAELIRTYPGYLQLALADRKGRVVASSLPLAKGPVNVKGRAYFQRVLNTRSFAVGDYQVGQLTKRPSINCAYPVFGATGDFEGVIFVAIDPVQLERPALRIDLPTGSELAVVDSRGVLLVHLPRVARFPIGAQAANQSLVQDVLHTQPRRVTSTIGLDEKERVYAWALVSPVSQIRVIFGEPHKEAFAHVTDIMYRNLAALAMVALAAILAGWLGARAFVLRPISVLLDATRRVGSGDFSARGHLGHKHGELSELASAFDDMADSLQLRERERSQAEKALQSEVDFITAVLGVVDALVAVTDRDGRIIRVNRAHERVTGYSSDEVKGKLFWEAFVPEDPDHTRQILGRIQAGQVPVRDQAWFRDREGGRHRMAWSITSLLDADGELAYVIATGRDITEQALTEDKLHLDEGRLMALLTLSEMSEAPEHEITDFAMEAGVKLTRSGMGYLAFMNDDESVLTMHSWSKTAMDECAIIDKPILYPVETTGLWGEAVRQRKPIITNDYTAPSELKKGYPSGHVHVLRHMNVPVFDGDRIVAVAGVGNKEEPYDESDVMQLRLLMDGMWRLLQRKRNAEALHSAYDDLEQRVQERTAELSDANAQLTLEVLERERAESKIALQAEELARSNAELERFAYVASHDLQEPLRKILAFGDRLKVKAADCVNEEAHDYLDRMQGAAARMQTLINDLLSYARVTTRARAFAATNLNEVVAGVLLDLELTIESTGAEINVGDLPTLQADETQMRQLFQNVIGNALKFRREGVPPVVNIEADLLPPDSPDLPDRESGRRYCQILIEDNGIGFEDRFLERIFDVFQRLHSREEYPGTGIGLAVCRKIVDRHGGTITARSVLGEGSTFVVTLPCGSGEGGGAQQ